MEQNSSFSGKKTGASLKFQLPVKVVAGISQCLKPKAVLYSFQFHVPSSVQLFPIASIVEETEVKPVVTPFWFLSVSLTTLMLK